MKIKILIGILAYCLNCIALYGQRVTAEQAREIAKNFLTNQDRENTGDLSDEESAIQSVPLGQKDTTMYAVSTSRNWVLIAGDLRVTPILAYSDENGGAFPCIDDMPPAMMELLEWYDSQISYIRDSSIDNHIHPTWLESLNENKPIIRTRAIAPLLYRNGKMNKWKQNKNNDGNGSQDTAKYFNKYCPFMNPCGFALTGCIAIAMGQIMWYWQWPYSAIVQDDDIDKLCQYDWSLMPAWLMDSTALEQANMVATLLHDIGLSVDMNYNCDNSTSTAAKMINALRNVFRYDTSDLKARTSYSNITWLQMIITDLNANRPVLYGGHNNTVGGHRFVIDGYNYEYEFHANFGSGGSGDGYYLLDLLSIYGDIFGNQSAVFEIHPDYPSCTAAVFTTNDVNENPFEIYGGGNMISYATTISSNKTGVIYAGNAITLLPPFTIQNGANVHLAIKDMHCDLSDMDNQSGLLIDENDTLAGDVPERYNLPAHIELQQTEEEPLSKTDDSTPYNLLGQPVDETYHGIVIQNGQKRVQ